VATSGRTARKPTLETVAARAGVSKSLVSLVLRNSPKVSAASREAVMRAVTELGYRPNAAARLLAERRSHTIGVLLNDLRQPWFADMLDGLTPALHAGGKHILLGDGRIDRMLDETLTWSFLDLGVDGLVLAGSIPMSQAIIDAASQIPTVAVGGRGLDVGLPRADILANDNHLGGSLAVRHLIELGHTRIAHISGLPSVAGRLRMKGYEDTMREAGLGGNIHVEAGDMSEEGGYRATVRLLSGPDRPTAIFAANDLTCVGALSAAAALGVRVPAELSLVGFDNSVFARLRALWLTSVDATALELGQRAARMLLTRIERPETPGQTVLLPPRLEVRGSSGPVPARLPAYGEDIGGQVLGADAVDQDDVALRVVRAQRHDLLVGVRVVPGAGPVVVGELDNGHGRPQRLSAACLSRFHSASTSWRPVGSAPIETRTDQVPSSRDGVTRAAPEALMESTQQSVCAFSASASSTAPVPETEPAGSCLSTTVCRLTGASTRQPGADETWPASQRALSRSRRSLARMASTPSSRRWNHSLSARNRRPSGMPQSLYWVTSPSTAERR
jgi:DNA-binding LacI/PurR family transcriptional regulator